MNNPRYWDEDLDLRECEIIERNGNLILVRDRKTGEEDAVAHHLIDH